MIESDQNDKERQDEIPPLSISNNSVHTNEPKQKRLREEISENEKLDPPSKKLCSFVDETMSKNNNIGNTSEINGIAKDISNDNKEDKIKSLPEESKNEIVNETDVAISKNRNNDSLINNDAAVEEDMTPNISTDIKQKESISIESVRNENVEDAVVKEEIGKEKKVEEKQVEEQEKEEKDQGTEEEEEVCFKPKKKNRKSQIENAEVVEGLELSVECASDKESSSVSENETEENKEPKPKTIIVKAKPNDSELDISSSEADKSDSQDASEVKPKQTTKRGKKKGRTSFSKTKNTDSEENDDVSDEDYSPKTKKKLKKVMTNKKTTESKRGRGKTKREVKKLLEKEDEEDENSNITTEDVRTEENESDMESVKSKSKDESDDEDTSKDRKRNRNIRPEDDKRIQLYKKYIRIAGIHVKSYNELWVGCKSNAARMRCLKALLEKNGVNGRPTVEKCKKAKERNESLKDVAELNTSNIISEGRVTRAQRNKDSNRESIKTSETPTKHREARSTFKRVLSVVDSDSE
ncbi:unnamed protein product [Xylocopa violacea]|uniref:HIRA-interacting protein 3 n=2 Tax=Xylocopa violacea TaxID=135666 RepID=A0ABP1NA04_XYLVO